MWQGLSLESVTELAAVLFVASLLQGSVGFAAGVFGIPVLFWFGWSLPAASAIIVTSTSVQNLWGFVKYRETLIVREMVLPMVLRVSFIPLGTYALYQAQSLPVDRLKQIVGGVILGITLLVALVSPKPREKLAEFWTYVVFPVSGFLQGLLGMGGPPMVLWVQAHDWSTERSRAYLFGIYLVSLPVSLYSLVQTFGTEIWQAVMITLALLPVVLVATALGLRLGSWLGRQRLRKFTLALLFCLALYNLLEPYLHR